jgi:CheY-like chemotaxis protein
MGGEVWAQNNPNGGSTFHFTAWFNKSVEEVEKQPTPVVLSDKKVLVVDDNKNNLAIVTHMLKSAGMHVHGLTDGAQAAVIFQEALRKGDPFQLCALDIQMPGLGGYEVARQIQSFSDVIPQTIFLAFTSSVEHDAERCLEAGFDGFLPKPINRQKLISMIEKLVGIKNNGPVEDTRNAIATQHSVRGNTKHTACILVAELFEGIPSIPHASS